MQSVHTASVATNSFAPILLGPLPLVLSCHARNLKIIRHIKTKQFTKSIGNCPGSIFVSDAKKCLWGPTVFFTFVLSFLSSE